jgi:mono/diheme cytochrome c family protein
LGKGLPEDFPISIHRYVDDCARGQRAAWRKWIWVALCAGIAFCISTGLVGCRSAPKLTAQQAEGKHLYDVGCAHCHEENDLHLKKVPPNLRGLFSRNTLPDGEPATDAEVERVLMTGKGIMPTFAYQMSKEQMDAVVAYLHTGLGDQHKQ